MQGRVVSQSESRSPARTYRTDIDGLRAIAVLAVVLFHARLGCPGGFVGVDIFFVISGYLITAIILRDLESNRFRLRDFWERRIRRIVPALTVMVAGTGLLGWFCFLPSDFEMLGRAMIAQGMGLSNLFHWRSISYFTPATEAFPLLHTWSLAVEEQFYVVLPVVLMLMHRWMRNWLRTSLLLACLSSLGLAIWGIRVHPDASFYLLPTRAWEMLLGSLLAASPNLAKTASRPVREMAGWGGLMLLVASIAAMDESTPFPSAATLIPTLGTAILIWSNQQSPTSSGTVLSVAPLTFIGRISYSLYLWHWPLMAVADYWFRDEMNAMQRAGLMVIAGVLAWLSYQFVETPFRMGKLLTRPAPLFVSAALATVLLMLGGGMASQGVFPAHISEEALAWLPSKDEGTGQSAELRWDSALRHELPEFGHTDGTLKCLLWGDSHAMSILPAIQGECQRQGIHGYSAMYSNTPPVLNFTPNPRFGMKERTSAYNKAVLAAAIEHRMDIVVLAACWSQYADTPGFEVGLRDTVSALQRAGMRVVLLRDVPMHRGHVPRLLVRAALRRQDPTHIGVTATEHRTRNERADACLVRLQGPGVQVLDPTPCLLSSEGFCLVEVDHQPLYRDSGHLTHLGASRLQPLLGASLGQEIRMADRELPLQIVR